MTQQQALDILKMGHSVFLTGAAGSGKTYVLNQYINWLKDKGVRVGITASTGIAATHIEGTTIHSWSGMGIKDELHERELKKMLKQSYDQIRLARFFIVQERMNYDYIYKSQKTF